jgi:tryptophan-rich sensory protein
MLCGRIYFGLRNPMLAGLEIIVLVDDLWNLHSLAKINKIAGYLFLPYLAWVSFAAVLNGSMVVE